MATAINLQIATFAGLGLPRTWNKPVASTTSTSEVLQQIYAGLPNPELGSRLLVSTTDGRQLSSNSTSPISTFTSPGSTFLPLRLSTRLCGGKGGFGSQLRAAGGRMSSRKNRDRKNDNGSSRNLDGRRLRTVEEAKKLAQYLEMKPEMERKEREQRRERWGAVIKAADETEERIRSGKMGSKQGRLDAEYVENKELAEEKIRDAVGRTMRESMMQAGRTGSESSAEEQDSSDEGRADDSASSDADMAEPVAGPSFFGWDDEDDDDDDDNEDEEENSEDDHNHSEQQPDILCSEPDQANQQSKMIDKGKGKQKKV